jgi:hypothetical protein
MQQRRAGCSSGALATPAAFDPPALLRGVLTRGVHAQILCHHPAAGAAEDPVVSGAVPAAVPRGHADRDVRGLQRLAAGSDVPAAARAQLHVIVHGRHAVGDAQDARGVAAVLRLRLRAEPVRPRRANGHALAGHDLPLDEAALEHGAQGATGYFPPASPSRALLVWVSSRCHEECFPLQDEISSLLAEEWVLGPGEWRYALDKLGFESVTKQLSDAEIEKLMTGPDRLFADKDRLIDSKDAFGVFDSDK